MGRKGSKILGFFFLVIFSACVKDKPDTSFNAPKNDSTANVYVVCEGNFGYGNAALTLYKPATDSTYTDVYKSANGQSMGDVFQSMLRVGDNLLLCVNNSDKIVVVDRHTWKQNASINVPKPRYILPVSNSKAYVSTLFSNKLYIINQQTMSVTGSIDMPSQNPEGMLLYNNIAYICTWDTTGNKLYGIDITTDKIVQTISLPGYAPQEIVMDKEQMLWVLSGNVPDHRAAFLTRIDPSDDAILETYAFPASADPIKPVFNLSKDTLYFIEANYNGGSQYNGIYRMSIHDNTLPPSAFIQSSSLEYFWGLGIDPQTGYIYVGDPKGFVQKGIVSIYRQDGTKLKQFNTAVGPGHFYFDTP